MKRFTVFLLAVCIVTALLAGISLSGAAGQNLIVTLKPGQSISAVNEDFDTKTMARIEGRSVYLVQAEDRMTLKKIQRDVRIESAEENETVTLSSLGNTTYAHLGTDAAFLLDGRTMTNFYGTQVLQAYVQQTALSKIQVDQVRDISTGAGTRIAYIDTGVDPDHPALRSWLDPGVDVLSHRSTSEFDGLSTDAAFLLDTDAAFLLDHRFLFLLNRILSSYLNSGNAATDLPWAFGHGTLVAGVLHAVAPNARIVPIKAFDANGNTTLFNLIEGVYVAINKDVDVLNMSFSTHEDSTALRKAIAEAVSQGIAVVASAGNDGRDSSDIYPAAFPNVYGVGATDFNDRRAPFSNYGKVVSVTAPGAFVVSTVPGGRYAAAWGTSFSAPLVSGSISLLASLRSRGNSNAPVVMTTADSIDELNPGFERKLGKGRVNARQALSRR